MDGFHLDLPDHSAAIPSKQRCNSDNVISGVGSDFRVNCAASFSSHIERNESLIVRLGNTDSLTDTLNRRSIHEILESEFRRNLRLRASMAVSMIDVDHFKN